MLFPAGHVALASTEAVQPEATGAVMEAKLVTNW